MDYTIHVLVAGLIVGGNLSAGLALLYRDRRFVRNALAAEGVVTALRKKGATRSGRAMTSPVVSFVAADGSRVEFTDSVSRYPARYQVGERVRVLYDRRNFQRARVPGSGWDLYFPAWLFLLVGGVLLLACALLAAVYAALTLLVGPMPTR